MGRGSASAAITNFTWIHNISCIEYLTCIFHQEQCYKCSQINGTYQYILRGKISDDRSASYYQMTTAFDPYYEHAIDFVSDFREYLYSACDAYGYDCSLSGGSIDEVDSMTKIYDNFPTVLGCIVAFVFCLMGLVFKTVNVPVRLFITNAVPMTFVYGLAVMT